MHNSLRHRITAASTLVGAVSVFSPTAFLIWAGSHVAMHLRARNYILNRCLQAERIVSSVYGSEAHLCHMVCNIQKELVGYSLKPTMRWSGTT